MRTIESREAPLPAGHYVQAVEANGLVFVSGILPVSCEPDRHIPEGIEAQARLAFTHLRHILHAADSGLDCLVSVQIFIPDIALWQALNGVYSEILGHHKPARTVVPCGPLHHGALIEVNATATTARPRRC